MKPCMEGKMAWQLRRLEESKGFVSKRIADNILFYHTLMYGESFHINHGGFVQIIHPANICIYTK